MITLVPQTSCNFCPTTKPAPIPGAPETAGSDGWARFGNPQNDVCPVCLKKPLGELVTNYRMAPQPGPTRPPVAPGAPVPATPGQITPQAVLTQLQRTLAQNPELFKNIVGQLGMLPPEPTKPA